MVSPCLIIGDDGKPYGMMTYNDPSNQILPKSDEEKLFIVVLFEFGMCPSGCGGVSDACLSFETCPARNK